jgi:predicted RNA-binding protein with TRAM domain
MTAEVGQVYEVEIVEERSNEWTGPQGVARLDEVEVPIPNAKKGEKFTIKIIGVETNQWTGKREARFQKV